MFYATITGNLGRDVENRVTKSGKNVASLSLGTTPRIKHNGEYVDGETIWVSVTVWDNLPEMLFSKGQLVMVTGQVRQNSYEKDGVTKQRLEIIADNIGIVHRTKRESQADNPWPAATNEWPSSTASDSVAVDDDMPF